MPFSPNLPTDLRFVEPCAPLTVRYVRRLQDLILKSEKEAAKVHIDEKLDRDFHDLAASSELKEIYAQRLKQHAAVLKSWAQHTVHLKKLLTEARDGSGSLFLPIGSTVVSTGDYSRVESENPSFRGPRPRKGSRGIVVGFNEEGNRAIKVMFFTDILDVDGKTTWSFDRDGEPLLIPFHSEELEVVSLSSFADGSACRRADFVQTHFSNEDDDQTQTMILFTNGAAIKITAYNIEEGIPWYQDAYILTDLELLKKFTPMPQMSRSSC